MFLKTGNQQKKKLGYDFSLKTMLRENVTFTVLEYIK